MLNTLSSPNISRHLWPMLISSIYHEAESRERLIEAKAYAVSFPCRSLWHRQHANCVPILRLWRRHGGSEMNLGIARCLTLSWQNARP